MILLDTQAWIWWMDKPQLLSKPARRAIDEAPEIAISPISCWELAMLVAKRRLRLNRSARAWVDEALAMPRTVVAPFSSDIALLAVELDGALPMDPADRFIAATALLLRAPLCTSDRRLRGFKALTTIW